MTAEQRLVLLLKEKNLKIATAESCTGGMISQRITDVSGASAVFECGVCSYSNEIKMKVLGVPKETINKHTELSLQTAEAMALGAAALSGADIAVSTTGVAGPTGGSEENPVGTVYVALAFRGNVISKKVNFNEDGKADRAEIRRRCTEYVLDMASEYIENELILA